MDKIFELLINIVSASKPKMLTGLNQKVRGVVGAFEFRSAQSTIPPVDRQILSHQVKSVEHGKPDCSRANGNRPARAGYGQAGRGGWKKRMPSCNEADRGSKFALTRKSADFQQVLNHKKGVERTNQSGTDRQQPKTVDDPLNGGQKWNNIIWRKVTKAVTRLQARIVKAVQSGDKKKIRDIMRLLARSKAAKLMAVRRVTSNRGKNSGKGRKESAQYVRPPLTTRRNGMSTTESQDREVEKILWKIWNYSTPSAIGKSTARTR
jgi:hypothetical protein